MLSSIKFHLENIRGSPVQVVKHCPLFLQALMGCGDTHSWSCAPQATPALCPKAAPAPGVLLAPWGAAGSSGSAAHCTPNSPRTALLRQG